MVEYLGSRFEPNLRRFSETSPRPNSVIAIIGQRDYMIGKYREERRGVNVYKKLTGVLENGQLYNITWMNTLSIHEMNPIRLSLSNMKEEIIVGDYNEWYYVSEDRALQEAVNAFRQREVDAMVRYYRKQTSRKKKTKVYDKIDPRARLALSRSGLATVRGTLGDDIAHHVTSFITGTRRR